MTAQLSYSIDGSPHGRPVLMSSSLGTTRAMWDGQIEALHEFRVIRFDHLGHGESPVPDGPYSMQQMVSNVLRLMDTLQIETASFVGLSLGGALGQWLAINAPDRVDRLVLMCTAAQFPTPGTWRERADLVRREGCEAVSEMAMGRWFTQSMIDAEPSQIARWKHMVATTPAEGYAGCCEALADYDVRNELGKITAPTLTIAGANDPSTGPVALQFIADNVPGARAEVVPQAAHLANVEQREAVNALLVEHLRGGK